MNICKAHLVALASLAAIGCTTTYTSTPVDKIDNGYPGVLYSLPMLQYEIVTTRQIRDCDPTLKESGLNIVGKVDITAQYVADPYATFQLDYTELSKPTSTSDLTIELTEDSRLKSINASADDKSAEILNNSFSILSNIALADADVTGSDLRTTRVEREDLPECKEEIKAVFSELSKSNNILGKLTGEVAFLSSEVQRLTLILASTESSESVSTELNETGKKLRIATRKLELLNNSRKPLVDKITYTEKQLWPLSSGNTYERLNNLEGEALTLEMPISILRNWWGNYDKTHSNDAGKTLLSKVNFSLNLSRMTDTIANERPDTSASGVIYRHPVDVQLQVCSGLVCNNNSTNTIEKTVYQSPQHGPYASLPFTNRAFKNTSLNAKFSDNGVPISVSFKSQKAALAEASGAVSNIASQLPALRQQLLGAELESLKRETELAEQTAKLNTAQAALQPSPTADLTAQKTILDAEVALLNAEIALIEATRKKEEL